MKIIPRSIGFIFIIFGIVWSIFSKSSCRNVCSNCIPEELKPCYFLFLFVGIIFIISGASVVLTGSKREYKKLGEK
jgi:hypothetical protein